MLRQQLRRGRQPVQRLPIQRRVLAHHGHHLRCAVGQRSGFVKGDDSGLGQPLQRVALPHQKSVLRGVADGGHNGRGRGQHQRAGAEHHQDRHRPNDLAGYKPCQTRRAEGDDHDPCSPPIRKPHDLGLARIRRLHQPDHPLDGAVLSHLGGLHLKGAELIHRAAGYRVPHGLVHRQRLAGHHRLIDRCLPLHDHAVHRHALPGQHPQPVAHLHLLGGDDLLLAAPQHPHGLGRQMHQLFNACPHLGHRQLLQQSAQLHDEGHLAGGKNFPNAHRGHQRQRHQHVRLDVKGRHQPDDGLQNNGQAAQHNGDPRQVKGQRLPLQQAGHHRNARNRQQHHVLFDAAQVQKFLQFIRNSLHLRDSFPYPTGYILYYTYRGICYQYEK